MAAGRSTYRGNQITAGLVESRTQIGLVEISLERGNPGRGPGSRTIRCARGFRAVDGYNPLSSLIAVTRLGGLTSAVISPGRRTDQRAGCLGRSRGSVPGNAADGGTSRRDGTPEIGGPVGGTVLDLRELFDVAKQYREGGADSLGRLHVPESISRVDLESLAPLLVRRNAAGHRRRSRGRHRGAVAARRSSSNCG